MRDNDLCHVQRSNGSRPSTATHPTLGGYGLIRMSGYYNECLTRGNWLTLYHIQSNE
jgi:hypothetical protein